VQPVEKTAIMNNTMNTERNFFIFMTIFHFIAIVFKKQYIKKIVTLELIEKNVTL